MSLTTIELNQEEVLLFVKFREYQTEFKTLLDNGVCQVTLDYHRKPDKRIMQVKCAKKGSF